MAQVIVYGPNGARTTANDKPDESGPFKGTSELQRLLAGEIEGREGYAGATQSEPLTEDYPGDYGGEDASTPINERESVVGVGNTGYDTKDYSDAGPGDPLSVTSEPTSSPGQASEQFSQLVDSGQKDFLNIPENAFLWDVDGTLYLAYEVPGAGGEVYEGNPMYMAYTVVENDLIKAGLISPEAPVPTVNRTMTRDAFDSTTIVFGNTDQLTSEIDNPFASFRETVSEQAQVAPWIKDPEMLSLIAEAALEGRVVSDAEWQSTTWYQTNNESQREWLRTFYSDPTTAAQLKTDAELAVANSLRAAGVSNAPQSVSNWMASKFVSGEWSDAYTSEQITLFADPYAPGIKDSAFQTYLDTVSITGLDRTTEKEREVGELYTTWLGPTLGALTDDEKADIAGKLRSDPDYQDKLIDSLKQSRLAAFSAYTNPELTYEDIARPWRNLTTSVWGETADETQGWWQEMVKTNDFAQAQTTLREKGLEQDVTQVTTDATQALQQALGQGSVSQTGVNV
jgi:hypothetical protein